MKIKKKYGNDFLTRPRYMSTDREKLLKSFFIWRFDKEKEVFTLSYLGMVNAFLSLLKLTLTVEVENGLINKYLLRKKWW